MKRSLAIVGVLAAGWLVHARPAEAAGINKEKLDALTAKLETTGRAWVKGEAAAPVDMKGVSFSADSVDPLKAYLGAYKRDTGWTYAVSKLLGQLRYARADVIQAVLPAVETAHSRTKNGYRSIPKYSKSYLDGLKMPSASRAPSTAEIMARMAVLEKRRDEKAAREVSTVRTNEMVYDVERYAYQLLLQAGNSRKDDVVVKALINAELRSSAMFITLLDLISHTSAKMGKEQARGLYNRLKPQAMRLAMAKKKDYFNRGKVLVQRNETSVYEKKSDYPGIRIIRAMNRLAKPAGMPKLKEPDGKKIDEMHKNKGKGRK